MKADLNGITGPRDRYHLNVVLFFALGIVGVAPVHFIVTATNFWMYKFRDPSSETWDDKHRNTLQTEFANNGNIVVNVGNIIFTITTVLLSKKIKPVTRACFGLSGMLLSFVVIAVLAQVNTDSWQNTFYILALVLLFLQSGFCSFLAVSLFDITAKFPTIYPALLASGQSMCEIFSAIVQMISLSTNVTASSSGLIYFVVGFAIVLFTTVLFVYNSKRNEFCRYYLNREIEEQKITWRFLIRVLNKAKYVLLAFGVLTGTTSMIHPGVTSLVVSTMDSGIKWTDIYFTPVATYLVFNISEFTGRITSLKFQKPANHIVILSLTVLRMVFIPLLMFCNVQPRDYLPVVFDTDWAYVIVMVIFGLSTGYVGNCSVLQISSSTTDQERPAALYWLIVALLSSSLAFSAVTPALIAAI